jgi:hypothetical protein
MGVAVAFDGEAAKKVLACIDRDELAQLACDLTSIPSPTGQEKAVAEFILAWFEANGLKAVRQDVEVDRPNAVGILKGDGTGYSLGFNGHTDTSFTEDYQDHRGGGAVGRGVRTEIRLSVAYRAAIAQSQYRRHRGRRAVPAELFPGRVLDLC